jgi:hypothetical protein
MTRVLVTGGAGTLGREVVKALTVSDCQIRIMSRRPAPATLPRNTEWARADVRTADGLQEAAKGMDVVVHAASNPLKDQYATEKHARCPRGSGGVCGILCTFHCGIERIPFPIRRSWRRNRPWQGGSHILRITQFHTLLDMFLGTFTRLPGIAFLPTDFKFQTISPREAAAPVVQAVCGQPGGLLPDVGGPEVLTVAEMAPAWLRARHVRRLIVPLRLPGAVARGFRSGYNTCPDRRIGKQTWREWLAEKYPNGRA